MRAFYLGLTTGLVYFTGTLYWITEVMVTYGGLARPVAVLVNGLLIAFLALFVAFPALGIAWLRRWQGPRGLLLAPAVWVTGELARTWLFGGFPWVLLGYSQTRALPVAQLASVAGVYGLSFLTALMSAALVFTAISRHPRRWLAPVITVALVCAIALWGSARINEGSLTRQGAPVTVGLVQGNVPQDQKWDPAHAREILDRYTRLTREVAARGATFIIWPESATPFFLEEDPVGGGEVRALARETRATLLVGSDQVERASPNRYYNAAFLVTPRGDTAAVYRKIHLVPFGEYVPLRSILFFAAPLVESVSDFSPGDAIVTLKVGDRLASTAICYEIVYPALVRQFVKAGSQLLTTITNDAWYGRTSAPHQHFEQAAMRAIEHGRYLARAANTGITGVVDPYGRVTARANLFETVAITAEARFLTGRTIYAKIGDLFAYACAAVTAAALVAARRPRGTRAR